MAKIKPKVAKTVGTIKIIPPIVGVPYFFLCASPTKIEIFCPTRNFLRTGRIKSPNTADDKKPIIIAKTAFVSNSNQTTPFLSHYITNQKTI